MLRFPLELPPIQKRATWPRLRASLGFLAFVLVLLFLVYGFFPAIEDLQRETHQEEAIRNPHNERHGQR